MATHATSDAASRSATHTPAQQSSRPHAIAVMPGDGIGKETVPEGLKVLEAVGKRFGIAFAFRHFDWSCDYYAKHGRMMPEDWLEQLAGTEAIFYGAVGWPFSRFGRVGEALFAAASAQAASLTEDLDSFASSTRPVP